MESSNFISDLFQSYEQDVASFIRTFNQRDARFLTMSKDEKESFLSFSQKGFPNAGRSFQQLNSEFKTLPGSVKTKLEGKMKDYKQKMDKIGERIKSITSEVENINLREDQEGLKDTHKSSLTRIGETLVGSVDRLKDIKRLAHESDDMTTAINSRLLGDREHLISIKKMNDSIQSNLNTATTLINSIRHKQDHEKILLGLIVFLLVVLNIAIFVYKIFT